MKNSFNEFGNIADKYVLAADIPAVKKKSGIKRFLGVAACLVLLAGATFGVHRFLIPHTPHGVNGGPGTLPPDSDVSTTAAAAQSGSADFLSSAVAYPALQAFPTYPSETAFIREDGSLDYDAFETARKAWENAQVARKHTAASYTEGLSAFTEKSVKEFVLKNAEKNTVYSPLNIYLALAMSAELTNGNTRAQLLELLGAENIESLRQNAQNLFNKTYCNDGMYICLPANSIWLNESVRCNETTLHTLADIYKAYSFTGKPGSDEYNAALQNWLNFATGDLLKDSVRNIEMAPETLLTLVSTLYLSAKWQTEFGENNETRAFHAPSGDRELEFMLREEQTDYYYADDFAAKQVQIENGGYLWFILPDEDKTVSDVLSGDTFYRFIKDPFSWEQKTWCYVKMKVPKFDISSDTDLKEGLRALGVTDLFDGSRSDFTPTAPTASGIFLKKVQHCARVAIDEKGITAGALTVMQYCGSAMPSNEVDFIVDRPFVFAVTDSDGSVLFIGTVNEP